MVVWVYIIVFVFFSDYNIGHRALQSCSEADAFKTHSKYTWRPVVVVVLNKWKTWESRLWLNLLCPSYVLPSRTSVSLCQDPWRMLLIFLAGLRCCALPGIIFFRGLWSYRLYIYDFEEGASEMSNYVGRGLNLSTYKTIFYVSEVIKFKKRVS